MPDQDETQDTFGAYAWGLSDTTSSAAPSESKQERSKNLKPLKLIALVLTVAAIVKELRLPKDQRTWNGLLAGLVPYDFRRPSIERLRDTFWDPNGKIIVGRPFGIGWTINAGAVVAKLRGSSAPG